MSTTTLLTEATLESAPPIPMGPVDAEISFFVPPADGSAPYNYVEKQAEGVAQNNYGTAVHTVTVQDMRGRESSFELEKHGFATHRSHTSPAVDFASDESIRAAYYPEVEQLLRDKIAGTRKVVIFDHTVRRADPTASRAPVLRAHIDQTPKAAAERVPLHVTDPEEAARLLRGRYRIVNVWRPINGPVESFPLAVGDSQTFPDDKLIPVQHRYPHRTGETAGVAFSPQVQWYYLSAMRNDERLFLQCFDSGSPARVPHTAFVDPRSTEKSKPRESIEVRALVFGD